MECLKFRKDIFTIALLLMLKQYYQISNQLVKSPMFKSYLIKIYRKLEKIPRH